MFRDVERGGGALSHVHLPLFSRTEFLASCLHSSNFSHGMLAISHVILTIRTAYWQSRTAYWPAALRTNISPKKVHPPLTNPLYAPEYSPSLGQTKLLPYRNSSIPQYHYFVIMEWRNCFQFSKSIMYLEFSRCRWICFSFNRFWFGSREIQILRI